MLPHDFLLAGIIEKVGGMIEHGKLDSGIL
jgi:hypothetical protein